MIRSPFTTLTCTFPPGAANGDNAWLPARARMAIKLNILFITLTSFSIDNRLWVPSIPPAEWLYARLPYNHLYIHYRNSSCASQENSTNDLSRQPSAKSAERVLSL